MNKEIEVRQFCSDEVSHEYGIHYIDIYQKPLTRDGNWHTMLSTDLNDKNGKRIWQGDIVKVLYTTGHEFKGEVIFRFGSFEVAQNDGENGEHMAPFSFCQRDTFEVIGNIYSTPELLK